MKLLLPISPADLDPLAASRLLSFIRRPACRWLSYSELMMCASVRIRRGR